MPSNPESVHLELMIGDRRLATCRVAPGAVAQAARRLYEEFRTGSAARGMAMTNEEIRATCWAPLAARLAGDTGGDGSQAFTRLALCFLVDAAFPVLDSGKHYTVAIAADGRVSVDRRPGGLLSRDHVVLGNHRQTVGAAPTSARVR